jgi:hypothetical protein
MVSMRPFQNIANVIELRRGAFKKLLAHKESHSPHERNAGPDQRSLTHGLVLLPFCLLLCYDSIPLLQRMWHQGGILEAENSLLPTPNLLAS